MKNTERLTRIYDAVFGQKVSSKVRNGGIDMFVVHLMGNNYSPQAFNSLNNEQKAEAVLEAMQSWMTKLIEAGAQREKQQSLEKEVLEAGKSAVKEFIPTVKKESTDE